MENQVSSKSIILNYGVYLGVISVIMSLIVYATGNHLQPHWAVNLISVLVMITFIALGMGKFKSSNGGYMSWGKAVKNGMGIVLISMLITILYLFLFINYIEPEFKTQTLEIAQQTWIDSNMTSEQVETTRKIADEYFSLSLYGSIIIMSLFFGFVISAITGAIMKRSPEEQY
ncbi:MAG: DUF4199 domain-containing protein [Flavobacteriaceae bacterium]|nr:DUF4199 domain-containing protein [Flavobacteriaceae bacterium]